MEVIFNRVIGNSIAFVIMLCLNKQAVLGSNDYGCELIFFREEEEKIWKDI